MAKKNGKKKTRKKTWRNKTGKENTERKRRRKYEVAETNSLSSRDAIKPTEADLNKLLGDPKEYLANLLTKGEITQALYAENGVDVVYNELCKQFDAGELKSPVLPILCVSPKHKIKLQICNVSSEPHYVLGSSLTCCPRGREFTYCPNPRDEIEADEILFWERTFTLSGRRICLPPRGQTKSILAFDLLDEMLPTNKVRERAALCSIKMNIDGNSQSEFARIVFDDPARIFHAVARF